MTTTTVRCFPLALLLGCALVAGCGSDQPTTNPAPALYSIAPDTVVRGSVPGPVHLIGENFVPESQARIGDADQPTSFVNSTTLEVELPAAALASAGSRTYHVVNPTPGGGSSGSASLLIANPVPIVDSITPSTALAGGAGFTLTFHGHDLYEGILVWNGNYVDQVALTGHTTGTVTVSAGYLQDGGAKTVSFLQFSPGGGTSSPKTFNVNFPVPTLTSISPSAAASDADSVRLRVYGAGFGQVSKIRFDGVDLSTVYQSGGELRAIVPAVRLASSGIKGVTVFTPTPGGGSSSGISFAIVQAPPRVTTLLPVSTASGDTGKLVTLSGRGYTVSSVVRVNGVDRTTTFVSATELKVAIPAGDLVAAGTRQLAVYEPSTGLVSAPLAFVVVAPTSGLLYQDSLVLATTDMLSDTTRGVIWAAIGSVASSRPGQVVAIDPATATIVDSLIGFGDPRLLALSDDGSYLYVGRADAPQIVRVQLANGTRRILPMPGNGGIIRADDIVVFQGAPTKVLVVTKNPGSSPRNTGTFVYEDTVFLPTYAQGHTGSNRIARGEAPDLFYGVNDETSEFGVRRLRLVPSGVVEEQNAEGLALNYFADIESAGGLLYLTTGPVVNGPSLTTIGNIPTPGSLVLDPAAGRLHVILAGEFRTYHLTGLSLLGTVAVPAFYSVSDPVRWGTDGLAVRSPTAVHFVRSPLIGP